MTVFVRRRPREQAKVVGTEVEHGEPVRRARLRMRSCQFPRMIEEKF